MEIFYESESRIAGAGFEIKLKGDRWYWSVSSPARLGSQGVTSHREMAIAEVRRCLAERQGRPDRQDSNPRRPA